MPIFRQAVSCVLSLAVAILPAGCDNPVNSKESEADIVLTDTSTSDEVARQLVGKYDVVAALVKNPGQSLTIEAPDATGRPVIVKLSFNREGKPVLTRPDGQQAVLELGLDGIKPVIRLVTERGQTFQQEVTDDNVAAKIARATQISPTDWAQAGIVAAGAVIIAWLGLKAIELTVVGIGYLALVALVASAAIITAGVVTKVFATLGWSAEYFINLFRQSFDDLAAIIAGAIQKFRETYRVKPVPRE